MFTKKKYNENIYIFIKSSNNDLFKKILNFKNISIIYDGIDPNEIETAKKSMSSFAFRQEFMASFEAQGGDLFKEEWIAFDEEEPDGDYFIAIDLAGFVDVSPAKIKKRARAIPFIIAPFDLAK